MSVITFFQRLLGFEHDARKANGGAQSLSDEEALNDEILRLLPLGTKRIVRYPPFYEGFPAFLSSEFLLSLQKELYNKLEGGVGLNYADFNRLVRPVIVNYARFVHLLPASENHHHAGAGGLLRHGLEVAYLSMNRTKNKAFDHEKTPSERSKRSSRWPVAGLIAGLLHDTGKAVTDMHVVYHPNNLRWLDSEGSIEEWTEKHKLKSYFVEWQKGRHLRHIAKSRDLVSRLCPPETCTWLREGGDDIYEAILEAIIGDEASPLHEPLMKADGKSTQMDMATGDSPQYMTGVPVIKLLMNAMIRLIQDDVWKVNEPGARVWTSTQGVFVAWSSGAKEVINLILEDKVEGIPRTPNSLLMRLIDEGIAEKSPSGDMYWEVAPDCLQKSEKPLILRCMKLDSADKLFPYTPVPSPVGIRIKNGNDFIAYPAPSQNKESAPAPASQAAEPNKPEIVDMPQAVVAAANEGAEQQAQNTNAPVLTEPHVSEAPSSDTSTVASSSVDDSDSVMTRLANIELTSMDEDGRQGFLEEALQCFSGAQAQEDKRAIFPLDSIADIKLVDPDTTTAPDTEQPAQVYSLTSILQGAPKPPKRPNKRNNKKPIDTPAASPSQQADSEAPAGIEGIDKWALTDSDKSVLTLHPEMASAFLDTLNYPDIFSAYQCRVFLPTGATEGGISSDLVPTMSANGWVWHDFSDASGGDIYIASRREGVVLADWLGDIVMRNIPGTITGMPAWAQSNEVTQNTDDLARAVIAIARPHTLPSGVEVLSVTIRRVKQVAHSAGGTVENALYALHLYRNAVVDWKLNRVHILPLEGELSSRRNA